ncbi:MAG: uracil-xanthine permease [Clostridia bacterium]|nr:uracil-xanthine permease [Clostridia bacterium]
MAKNLVYDIHDKPKFGSMLIFALQQVLAILAATIAVPAIIGLPTQMPAAIFGAGVGTLIYQLFTKRKSPVFLGSSFAFLSSLFVALAYGYAGIVLGSVIAGLVYVVIALIIRFVGTEWVNKLMPPVIIGPTVAVIGLSLAGNAMGDMVKSNAIAAPALPSHEIVGAPIASYNLIALLCGLVTFFVVVICSTQKRRQMPRLIPFIIGIAAGYVTASVFTVIGTVANIEYFKIINWQPIIDNFVTAEGQFRGIEAIFKLPDFAIVEAIKELATGSSSIDGASWLIYTEDLQGSLANCIAVVVAFLPVALVVFAEHIADHKNLSSIIDRDLIKDPGLARTLLGDGVGSIGGTLFGICPNTTYGESVGCVAITGNASVITITTAAIMCLCLSFFSPLMVLLQSIPSCVMGGVCLTLYGFIAVSGLKMIKDVDLNENKNLFVISAILIAGIGGLAIQIPYAFGTEGGATVVNAFVQVTPVATALILGIITNAVLSKLDKKAE